MNSISIWEDVIILKWDGQLPEGVDRRSISDPSDVIPVWKHLDGHIKWSKKLAAFTMRFGKQNLKRIHAQFGQVPITNGGHRVKELKEKQESLFNLAQLVDKVKTLPEDQLPQYNFKMKPLAPYQHRGVALLCNSRKLPLFASCGLGKTYMVLNSIQIHKDKGVVPPGKTLIAVKLATIDTGWVDDAKKFTDLNIGVLWVSSKNKKRKKIILERLNTEYDAYIINHEGIRLFEKELAEKKFQKVVIDESTILKNFRGGRAGTAFGKSILNIAKNADWRVIMSGTPAPNSPADLWGQFNFLDPDGLILEPNFNDFQHENFFCLDLRPKQFRTRPLRGNDPHKWVPTAKTVEAVAALTQPFTYRVRMEDHLLDMPELTSMLRKVEMGPEQERHYIAMQEQLRVVIDDSRIIATVKIAQLMKLRQITGGFIIDHQEKTHAIDDNPKLQELDSLIFDEIGPEKKVVIYCQYQWEIKTLEERYKKEGIVTVYGGNNSDKNIANIRQFRESPDIRIIVLHPKSAAHGVTFTMAHHLIFYSIDHSAEDNYQCIHRIKRAGQKHPMWVYFILCRGTIDELIYKCIQIKNANQSSLIDEDQLLLGNFTEALDGLQTEGTDFS
jgi:SNF2 family DNA or RNA helicase